MKTIVTAFLFMLLMVGASHAQLMSCQTFDRFNAHAPQLARNYLDNSKELFVRVCGDGDHPQYFGASTISKDGDVCHYSEYELNPSRTDPSRLERVTSSQQTYMLVTKSACPSPLLTSYAATNGVPQDVFERLVHAWSDAISSPASFDQELSGVSDAAVRQRLRNAVLQGKSTNLIVRRATPHRDFGLWKTYELDVADPDQNDRFYLVTMSSWFGRAYAVSGIGVGIY